MNTVFEPNPPLTITRNKLDPLPLRRGLLLTLLACFAFAPASRALSLPPDGDYPNSNTAEGTDALFSLTTGGDNRAIGFNSLYRNTTGNDNTANGAFALRSNTTGFNNTATGAGALLRNTDGVQNTANGNGTLLFNASGLNNTANGVLDNW